MIATCNWLLVRKSGEWKIHSTIHVLLHDDDVQIDSLLPKKTIWESLHSADYWGNLPKKNYIKGVLL